VGRQHYYGESHLRYLAAGWRAEEMLDSPGDHPQPLLIQEGSQSKLPSSLRRG
jgi:hypothetical protein